MRMDQIVIAGMQIIIQRVAIPIGGAAVGFAGRHAIAKHFHHIFDGHLHARKPVATHRRILDPIFQMVPVSPFVVQPCAAVAFGGPFRFIGAAVSLIIPYTGPELLRTVLGEIMGNSLPVQANLEAMLPDQVSVPCNGRKMVPYITDFHSNPFFTH